MGPAYSEMGKQLQSPLSNENEMNLLCTEQIQTVSPGH